MSPKHSAAAAHRVGRFPLRRTAAAVLVTALISSGLVMAATVPASASTPPVTGTVFRDFNSNGIMNTAGGDGIAVDQGLAGVTATAYNVAGSAVGTATSTANGSYTIPLAASVASGAPLRIEFSTLPAGYSPSFAGTGTASQTVNGTDVQFTTAGATTGVNFGVNKPGDYSSKAPTLVVPMNYSGTASLAPTTSASAASVPWNTTSTANPGTETTIATTRQTGSVWGDAADSANGDVYLSTLLRRQSGLGPGGLGEIYRVAGTTASNGTVGFGSGATPWLNVASLVDVGSTTLTAALNLPSSATGSAIDTARGLTGPGKPALDAAVFGLVGKVGIGGIALSTDNSTLYFVNLADMSLYSVPLADPTTATKYPLGLADGERPWALTVHDGTVYVGVTQTGLGTTTADYDRPIANVKLTASVLSAPESTLSPASTWTRVLDDADLSYDRSSPAWKAPDDCGTNNQHCQWNAWTDTWNNSTFAVTEAGAIAYPEPMLSDLSFDTDGYLSLGFTDRLSLQTGINNYSTTSTSTTYQTYAGGDILISSPNPDGSYTLESDGTVGTRTSAHSATEDKGPGGKEFYEDSNDVAPAAGAIHNETATGGLASLAGVDDVVSTVYDALSDVNTNGLKWISTKDGLPDKGFNAQGADTNSTSGAFRKAGGLGDVELLAEIAPIQIGNRVWFDADQDGVQDADEPSVPGVTVNLLDSDGNVIGTRVTDANGDYEFSSNDADLDGKFTPNGGDYTVQFVTPTSGSVNLGGALGAVPWSDMSFTKQGAGSDDAVDSDVGTSGATKGEVSYTAGSPGENDSDIDAGLEANAAFSVEKKISSSGGVSPAGSTYTVDVTATDFRNAPLTLADPTLTLTPDTPTGAISVPVGTTVQLNEENSADYDGVTITNANGDDVSGGFKVAGTNATANLITVTNTLKKPGTFSVTKSLSGDGEGLVSGSQTFTPEYSTDGGTTWTALGAITAGGTATSPSLAAGTQVRLGELKPSVTAGFTWGTPVWTIGGTSTSGTASADPTIVAGPTITIGDGTNVTVALKNPTTIDRGGFTVTKTVTGGAASFVPSTTSFTVDYTYTDTDGTKKTDSVDVKNDGAASTPVTGIPYGATVTVSEETPPNVGPAVSWGTPVWGGTDVTDKGDGTATFVATGQSVSLGLTNPTTLVTGGLTITKSVTGAAASAVPDDFAFTIDYSYTGTSGQTVTVTKATPAQLAGIPAGSVVTLSEAAVTGADPVVAWGTPTWSGTGVTDNGDGTATVTVTKNASIAVGLTNPTTQVLGGFSVTKSVTGDAAAQVANDFEFTVDYTVGGVTKTLTVTKSSPTTAVSGLPVGTSVTVKEETPGDAGADVQWDAPNWTSTSGNLTHNADGSVSFAVGTTPIALQLENPTTRLFGSFSITKHVTGEAASTLTPGYAFTGTYSYQDDAGVTQSGSFSVTDGGAWSLPGASALPAGTEVTLGETTPTGGLPALSGWANRVWSGTGVTANPDGTATITIGDATTVAVTLTNPTTVTPQVDIEKGDGTGQTIVNDADTMDDAQYYAPGEKRTIVLTATNTGTEHLRDVTLTDTTLSGAEVDALVWTFPDGTTANATLVNGVWTATWAATTLADGAPGAQRWMPGDVIYGTATLTVNASDAPHVDRAAVEATGDVSGTTVGDHDDYNAYTAAIQVIKYDGNKPDPAVKDASGDWIIPAKPLVDPAQDANTVANEVIYVPNTPEKVRWVVTNTGTTDLTDLTLKDVTGVGPSIGSWTCDLTPIGGTDSAYDFVKDGPWDGVFAPGQSFFCEGTLNLGVNQPHEDDVTATGTVVVPAVDQNGTPTGDPELDTHGKPVVSKNDDGTPRLVTDTDPFNAFGDPPPAAGLAFTGTNTAAIVIASALALLGLLAGVILMLTGRRRRPRTS